MNGFADWILANPNFAYGMFVTDPNSDEYGEDEDKGLVWDNGDALAYDSEDNLVSRDR